ncbi:MAG: hypothetical protein QGG64_04240 [Candidatus Latescibacteria bacterium]|nr:hypothetical protein [Candidatus Latescibacterota bacterium]
MADRNIRRNKISGTIYDLKLVARHLVKIPPWAPILSIIGPPSSWRPNKYSEFNLAQWGEFKMAHGAYAPEWARTIENLIQALSLIFIPRVYPFRGTPSSYPFDGDLNASSEEKENVFAREKWFFVNGIATDPTMLQMSGAYLYELFGRPIELINNPTDGILVDLIESVFGRTFDFSSTPAQYTKVRVENALASRECDRVVLLAHSQGAIVASNVVRDLVQEYGQDDRRPNLEKLEVYTFGSAADEIDADTELSCKHNRLVPYIVHYANTKDVIAQLGVLQKRNPANQKEMDGRIYTVEKSGHLFNAHYLSEVAQRRYVNTGGQAKSRLYEYLEGNLPDSKFYNTLLLSDLD